MTHTYNIQGMTCGGCKASVEKQLSALDGVTSVNVNLELGKAEIGMKNHIPTNVLKNALSEKFTLSEAIVKAENGNIFNVSEEQQLTKLQQLKPLFLIFGFIALMTIAINYNTWNSTEAMLDFMGLFYFVFSLFKFFDLKGFAQSFTMYDPLAKILPAYGNVYPFIELALGVCLLARVQIPVVLIVTILILGVTTIGVLRSLLSKQTIQCACLGTVLKLPMTQATFIENAIMIIMATVLLVKNFVL